MLDQRDQQVDVQVNASERPVYNKTYAQRNFYVSEARSAVARELRRLKARLVLLDTMIGASDETLENIQTELQACQPYLDRALEAVVTGIDRRDYGRPDPEP